MGEILGNPQSAQECERANCYFKLVCTGSGENPDVPRLISNGPVGEVKGCPRNAELVLDGGLYIFEREVDGKVQTTSVPL